LAGNPLLLTMMLILNRTEDLPRDRVRLYEKCAELLLHQWKAQEALNAAVLADNRVRHRKIVLSTASILEIPELIRGLPGKSFPHFLSVVPERVF
jgi:predicted NACHT family NTPase